MSKVLFIPFSVVGSLLAGFVAKRVFAQAWGLFDKEEPPEAGQREATWARLIGALALQGAIFAAVRGFFDHAARRGFERLTGSWPGKRQPEDE